jgi:Serine/Threonine/Tyrosine Kinase found in polyvalent proteins
MSSHEPNAAPAGIPLQAHVEELRRRCAAVARLQGGSTHYLEEIALFRNYALEKALMLPGPPPVCARPPDDEGNEHQVWFQPDTASFFKITWPDFFGLQVIYQPDEEERASPIAYLERWHLHNELFGDSVKLIGALDEDGKLRLVIQQPAIEGQPATLEQINEFFIGNGWRRFSVNDDVAYFDPEREVVISDTHRGNLILMDDGLLAPIDLRVQPVAGALLDYVIDASR